MSAHRQTNRIASLDRLAAARRGCAIAAIAVAALLLLAQPFFARAAEHTDPLVVVAKVDGTITPVMERYVERAIERAEKESAAALVLQMDTPGGLGSAMDGIVRDILESDVPVVVYVAPRGARAASAGVFITYAAHVAAMAPGTNIGSASPIFIGEDGASEGTETLQRKVTNDAVAQIVNLANLRGRNAEWAEQAVREAANVTADEALRLNVIDVIAPDLPALLAAIDGRAVELAAGPTTLTTGGATIRHLDMTFMEEFFQLLADPTIAYLLLSLGMLGIYIELSNPGISVPGILGGISVLLGLYGLGTLPVNWAGVLLMALGFLLLVAEIYVPSFGTLTVGGLISFILGSYLLLGPEVPPGYEIARPVIWTLAACLLAFSFFLAGATLKSRWRRPATGKESLIGTVGTVRSALNPTGLVLVHGELWNARLESPNGVELPPGSSVVVTHIDGLRLTVRPATAGDGDTVERAERRHGVGDRREVIPVSGSAVTAEQPSTSV